MSVTAVIGTQWGDEGKGKIVDILAQDADMVIRANGGNNAGHTIQNEHTKSMPEGVAKLHIVPVGVFNPNILNVIGAGCVVDMPTLAQELRELKEAGLSVDNLIISKKAHLVMPWHILLDEAEEELRSGRDKIGTTKRGMGPVFSAKHARKGLRVEDVLKNDFRDKFFETFNHYQHMLQVIYKHANRYLPDVIYNRFMQSAETVKEFIGNAEHEVHSYLAADANILLEGAQAVFLDIDHGTYPFVTSSSCTVAGLAQGSGIPPSKIRERIGVVKAYATRVGAGAFPTKLPDRQDERLRQLGNEFGATTGRPRMCGWLDLPLLNYANRLNDFTSLAVTKLDILNGMPELRVGTGYIDCEAHNEVICRDSSCGLAGETAYSEPVAGWSDPLSDIKKYNKLPKNVKAYVGTVENAMDTKAKYISVGPHREQTIVR